MNSQRKNFKESHVAWAAGLFDGDGHASIHWAKGSQGKIYFRARASITNCDRSALEFVQQIVGVGRVTCPRSLQREKWRSISAWVAEGADAQVALKKLFPYLRVKKEQAYWVLRLPRRGREQAPRRYSIFTRIAQAVIATHVRSLKHV